MNTENPSPADSGPPSYASLIEAIQAMDTPRLAYLIGYIGRELAAKAITEANAIGTSASPHRQPLAAPEGVCGDRQPGTGIACHRPPGHTIGRHVNWAENVAWAAPTLTSPVPVRAEDVLPGGYTLPAGLMSCPKTHMPEVPCDCGANAAAGSDA